MSENIQSKIPVKYLMTGAIAFICLAFLPAAAPAWNTVGMGGGGAQYGPSISPIAPGLRFVGSDMSGWYRSTDNGATWNTLDFYQISADVDYNFNNGVMCPMAYDPVNPDIVYGYGRQQDSQNNPSNLLISNDAGVTFSILNSGAAWGNGRVTCIYPDRGNASFLLIGTDSGVYRSTNGGTIFTGPAGTSGYVCGIFIDQASPVGNRTCYAGTDAGVFKSTNSGASWTPANAGLPAGASALCFTGACSAGAIRLFEVDANNNYIYTSSDGTNWTMSCAADAFSKVASADNDTATAYAANGNDRSIWKTADGGAAWAQVFIDSNPVPNASLGWIDYDLGFSWGGPNYEIKVNPMNSSQSMVTNMGETFISNDAGATWQEAYSTFSDTAPRAANKKWASCGLEMTSVWHYDIDPNNPDYHYICYTDIGFARSTDAGNTWYDTGRKGSVPSNWTNTFYQIAFNPVPGTILAAVSGLHDLDHSAPLGRTGFSGGVAKSTDYGATWTQSSTGLPVSPTTSIIFDPVNQVYFAAVWGRGVYKSADAAGASWSAVAAVANGTNRNVYSLKLFGGTLYCLLSGQSGFANAGGLFISTNQGASWTNIASNAASGGPLYYPMEFDVNPADPDIIYLVGQDNSKGGYQGGLYRTLNGGTSWTLMNMPVGAVQYGYAPSIDPGNTNTVYFGTENLGFFKTTDNGNTWTRETGVPFSSIQRITFAPDALYVCTFGGGVWVQPKIAGPTPSPTATVLGATPTYTNTYTATPTATGTYTYTATQTVTVTIIPASACWVDVDGNSVEAIDVSDSPYDSYGPDIAIDSQGRQHIVWIDASSGSYQVYYKRWTGSMWVDAYGTNTANARVTSFDIYAFGNVRIQIGPGDVPYILCTGATLPGTYAMYLIKWNGSAWAGADGTAGIYPLPLGSSTVHGGAGLSLDASGNPHVAWWESGARSYYLKWSGSAWVDADGTGIESAMILDQNMEAASLALDSAGNPNIAFIGDPVQKSLNMIKWNGSSWVDLDGIGLESMVVFTSTKYVIMPVLKLDGMDRPHIMFLEHNLLNQTPFYYLQWNGSAWVDADGSGTESALVSIPENTGVGSGLGDAMWLDSVGRPYISASNQGIINIIRWNGSAWSDLDGVGRESLKQVVFPYSGGNGPNLSVLKILSGKIHVLLDPGQKEVYYMQYTCMPAVPVPSFTNTLTATQTPAVMTGSPTATFTNTPVFTPTITPTRQAGPLAFNSCGLYPNPFNYVTDAFLNIAIGLSRTDIDGLTLEIYTPAFRKVREKRLNSADAYLAAASRLMQYDAANLKGLASGVYYYMVKAELGGVTARSKADVLILIR